MVPTLKKWWKWFEVVALSRHTTLAVAVWSFVNPLFVPIPAESLLVPVVLANRRRAVFYTALSSVAATAGAVVGYLLARFLFDTLLTPLISSLELEAQLAMLSSLATPLATFVTVFFAALTLIPDAPFIAAAGLLHIDIVMFGFAFFIGRTLRFALIVGLALAFGERAWRMVEQLEHRAAAALVFGLVLILVAVVFLAL